MCVGGRARLAFLFRDAVLFETNVVFRLPVQRWVCVHDVFAYVTFSRGVVIGDGDIMCNYVSSEKMWLCGDFTDQRFDEGTAIDRV